MSHRFPSRHPTVRRSVRTLFPRFILLSNWCAGISTRILGEATPLSKWQYHAPMTVEDRKIGARRLADAKRIVVKVGSSLLVDGDKGRLNRTWLESLAADVAA